MKILVIFSIILSATCLFFTNCKKYKEVFLKPRLFITLVDDSGHKVTGATVRLYKNSFDPGIIQLSDTGGHVLFENLDLDIYYWRAVKGCMTNLVSDSTLNRPLIEDVVLYGTSIMSETGLLRITNTSIEPYKVIDSLFTVRVYVDTPYAAYKKAGTYKLRTEKLSTPGIGVDSLVKVFCGDTTKLVLPY